MSTARRTKFMSGEYEAAENILHLWCDDPVQLKDVAAVEALFAEISGDWIDRYTRADRKPVLLVDFSKLAISPSVTESYAEQVRKHRPRFEAVYRYNAGIGFTGVAVNLGSVKAGDETNLFADEASARAAIRASRAR